MSAMLRASCLGVLVAVALVLPARADVTFVSGTGSEDRALQSAIDGAADGDILVLAGTWSPDFIYVKAVIDGKGLTLVAEPGTSPRIVGLKIRNVPAGSQVLVRGLTVSTPWALPDQSTGLAAVRVDDCAGSVWFEDCSFTGYDGLGSSFGISSQGFHGLSVRKCSAVNVERCTLAGGSGANEGGFGMDYHPATNGGRGADVLQSSIAFRDCQLVGGKAGIGPASTQHTSGAGLHVKDSTVLLAGCSLHGGDDASPSTQPGSGLLVEGSSSVAQRSTSVEAGAGSPPAPAVVAPPGAVVAYADPSRSIELPSPLPEGAVSRLTLTSQPGDVLFLLTAFQGAAVSLPAREGMLSLALPFSGPFLLGSNPSASGTWELPFVVPDLVAPDLLGWTTLLQLAAQDGNGVHLEGTTSLVLLEGATVFLEADAAHF